MKRIWIMTLLLCLTAALALTACGSAEDNAPAPAPAPDSAPVEIDEAEIIDCVIDNFSLLAEVPRPSHHEEAISAFLMDWAAGQGLEPVQDSAYNVMFEVPPSENMEDLPLTILQGHMDMVVAVADGKTFDPLTDTVSVIRDDAAGTLSADGTSLGSDDGAGVAIIMSVVQGRMAHGPLRVIITADEEDGMEGAFNMDSSWLEGAAYLINIDNETSSEVLVSTAAGDSVRASGSVTCGDPAGDLAMDIKLSGLTGGHSGVEIDKGRLNGLVGMAGFLLELENSGLPFELASFEGGTAANAIPTGASCTVVIAAEDEDALIKQADTYFQKLKDTYSGIESGLLCSVTRADALPQTVSEADRDNAVRFVTEIIDGVYTWSSDMDGLVESSSNLGLFSLNGDGVSAVTYIRSSAPDLETEILNSQLELAEACGYEAEAVKMADAWPYNPSSPLLALTKEAYREQNGKDITVAAVHAGLECGTFKQLAPELDMISIGPDISDAHTIRETLYLDSIPKVWNLLQSLLIRIGE